MTLKPIKAPKETIKFLTWLVRQDVTFPSVITSYLKWNHYSKQEINSHLLALNLGCIETEQQRKYQLLKNH